MTNPTTQPQPSNPQPRELRQWNRSLPRVSEVVVDIGGEERRQARVSDESFGGIGARF